MNILTSYIYPPIPTHDFDYCACYEGQEDNCSFGRTREEAITNLQEENPNE